MIRRIELGALTNIRRFAKRFSMYKYVMGGSLAIAALYSIPSSSCADMKDSGSSSDDLARKNG